MLRVAVAGHCFNGHVPGPMIRPVAGHYFGEYLLMCQAPLLYPIVGATDDRSRSLSELFSSMHSGPPATARSRCYG